MDIVPFPSFGVRFFCEQVFVEKLSVGQLSHKEITDEINFYEITGVENASIMSMMAPIGLMQLPG